MNSIRKTGNEIVDLAEMVIKTMFMIVIVYLVAEALFGTVPANVGTVVVGLGGVFILVSSKKARKEVLSFGHKK